MPRLQNDSGEEAAITVLLFEERKYRDSRGTIAAAISPRRHLGSRVI